MLKKTKLIVLIIILVALVAAFAYYESNKKTDIQYFQSKVEKGDIRSVVEATGTINAVISVQVGSQVSGTIYKLFADFNSRVKKGQIIAEIEPSLFEGALLQAKADLENARANLASARAQTEKARANAVQTQADYQRTQALAKEGVLSQQQLDLNRANAESAQAQVAASLAQEKQAAAQVSQKEAAVEVAQTNMNHTIIRAPIDGTVVNRAVDIGQTVAASLQAPTLFTIAQDLTKMQVYAKTDESDVGQIKPGQEVTFKVDAFPRDTFKGSVQQVRMNSTVVQNVVTYDTIVGFDNPDMKLFPGMTAYVTIPVATAMNVLKVPNGALRYKPDLKPEQTQALYQKYGITTSEGRLGQMIASAAGSATGDQSGSAAERGAADKTAGMAGRGGAGSSPNTSGSNSGVENGGNRWRGANRGAGDVSTQNNGGRPQSAGDIRSPRYDTAIVWKLRPDKTLEPVRLKIGITDHTVTEVVQVVNGSLNEGDELVTGSSQARGSSGPLRMGGGPGGGPGGRPGGR